MVFLAFQKLSCLPYVLGSVLARIMCLNVSEALMFAICVGFCSCPYNVFKCFRSSHVCHVCLLFLFLPVQSLFTCFRSSYSFCRLCLSLSSLITLPQTVRLFYVSLRSRTPNQQYTVLSFSLMRMHGNSRLHVLYSIAM